MKLYSGNSLEVSSRGLAFPVHRAPFPPAWDGVHRDAAAGTPRRRLRSGPGERHQPGVGRFWADPEETVPADEWRVGCGRK